MSHKDLPVVWSMLGGVLLAACPGVGLIVAPGLPLWLHVAGALLVVGGWQIVDSGSRRFLATASPPRPGGRHRRVWRHRQQRGVLY